MKILIVDDETPARERLKKLVAELPDRRVVDEAANGVRALQLVAEHNPDVVLMDIRMPEMDGLEAARHLADLPSPPAVIFTTAYDQFTLEAFDTNAIAYLLKPVRREKLEKALAHAERPNQAQRSALQQHSRATTRRQHICARIRDELRIIPVDKIFYFQADQKYVTVKYFDGEVLIEESLKSLEQEFADKFLRIHRNALVAVDYVDALEKDSEGHFKIRLHGIDNQLEVSRRMVPEVRRVIRKP